MNSLKRSGICVIFLIATYPREAACKAQILNVIWDKFTRIYRPWIYNNVVEALHTSLFCCLTKSFIFDNSSFSFPYIHAWDVRNSVLKMLPRLNFSAIQRNYSFIRFSFREIPEYNPNIPLKWIILTPFLHLFL